ncbi:MAG: class A beta-lactamase-related serine hydrolase [Gloeomargarita sp. SKYG116]|nr:class A beta-lactamase-related serine hydrolase [Gloeomargarita sp. SKYG116]MDW8401759.1 serine hydrolase [Gloeomargarita sp. SKYGB_i_bin116]
MALRLTPPGSITPASTSDSQDVQLPEATATLLTYNVRTAPPTTYNPDLQAVVQQMVARAQERGLPTAALSITLMDVSRPEMPQIAGYQQQVLRYPASVVKLFWLVMFLAYQQAGLLTGEVIPSAELVAMMQQSSNDAASRVIDVLTGTESGDALPPELFAQWKQKREQINHFFREAGYGYLNLKHKNFPIYSWGYEEPWGRELQLRGGAHQPSRNQLNTWQAARLLYEIYTLQAVSPATSQKIQEWMSRPAGLPGFLGDGLPPDAQVMGKEGHTSTCRHDSVIIQRRDGRMALILVVFGDDPAYSADEQFLPELARMTWQALNRRYP